MNVRDGKSRETRQIVRRGKQGQKRAQARDDLNPGEARAAKTRVSSK